MIYVENNCEYIIPYDKDSELNNCFNRKNLRNFKKIPNEILRILPILNYQQNKNFIQSEKFWKINIELIE